MTGLEPAHPALDWRAHVVRRVDAGARFAALFATAGTDGVTLSAALATPGHLALLDTTLAPDATGYPALTPLVPAAFWYERAVQDLTGLVAQGHPRPDPLLLPRDAADPPPRPGSPEQPRRIVPHERPLPSHLEGAGIFTLPHGPVRSGVLESVEYLIETPGEDIAHLRVRPHAKHRGLDKRFEALPLAHGVLLAERVEGISSVAHALAYCHAVETLAGTTVPPAAALLRVLHAELERVANHLDAAMRLTEAAALAVAVARFGWHKERVLRLRSRVCGSRFGRGVVVPGGVAAPPAVAPGELLAALGPLERDIRGDLRAALLTPSFLDRLRGTGPLPADVAARHGALGPVGRAAGAGEDTRSSRPYDAYAELQVRVAGSDGGRDRVGPGDALERLQVRVEEVAESFRLLRAVLGRLTQDSATAGSERLRAAVEVADGRAIGWAEAAQGEVLYLVEVRDGALRRVAPRSASFHNLALFHSVFAGDIFTDFPFIEASFGLSVAGVAG